jgi:hypothetical protein
LSNELVKRFLFLQQLEKYIGHATVPAKLQNCILNIGGAALKSDRPLRQRRL